MISFNGSNKSSDIHSTPLRRIMKANGVGNSLRRTNRPSDILRSQSDKDDKVSNPDLKSVRNLRRELLDKRPGFEKPRPSDAFLLRIPKECSSETEEQPIDLRTSRLPTFKPRLSDAFLKVSEKVPECSSDADDESDDDLLKSRRVVKNSLRRTVRPSEIKVKPDKLTLSTEDDDLMGDGEKSEINHTNLTDFSVSGRFETNNGHLCLTSDHSLVLKRRRGNCKAITYEPSVKVKKYSSDTYIIYQNECDCNFCRLLRHYHDCPLLFSRKFVSDKGHGFFHKL